VVKGSAELLPVIRHLCYSKWRKYNKRSWHLKRNTDRQNDYKMHRMRWPSLHLTNTITSCEACFLVNKMQDMKINGDLNLSFSWQMKSFWKHCGIHHREYMNFADRYHFSRYKNHELWTMAWSTINLFHESVRGMRRNNKLHALHVKNMADARDKESNFF